MKKLFCLVAIILVSGLLQCQIPKKIDSLKQSLFNENISDTTKISLYIALSSAYVSINIDSLGHYAKKGYDLSLKHKNYKLEHIYNQIGLIHQFQSNPDSARYYYDKALTILDTKEDKLLRSNIYNNYGMSYTNNMEKSIEYTLKAIELVKDNHKEVAANYFNLGIFYYENGFMDEFKKYLKKAYQSSLLGNNYRIEGVALRGLAYAYKEENKLDSAKVYLEDGVDLCKRIGIPETCFGIYNELGEVYNKLGQYSQAEKALLEARDYALIRKDTFDILGIHVVLAQNEFDRKQYNASAEYFRQFENVFEKNEPVYRIGVKAYKVWSEVEEKRGDFQKANLLLKKSLIFNDTLNFRENKEALANADAKYETEKKDKEIATQQLALKEQESEIQKKKAQNNYMLGGLVFLIVGTTLLVFLFKQRQKRKNQELLTLKREFQIKTLESLIEGEEKERHRVAKELHDGVNGDLAAIKYKLSSLLEMNNAVIKEAITMIDDSCKQVRAISHNLIPPSLENFNLLEATQVYCANLNESTPSIEINFQHLGDAIKIPKKAEVNAFRIIQELVTNAIRHAEASNINVQISARENIVQITVEDDGKGFDKNTVESDGIGLGNVQSRADYLNATIDFISNDKGTSYTIDINKEQLNGD
ncbi:MAG: ATP-binding protein [Allomuricauda sp.]